MSNEIQPELTHALDLHQQGKLVDAEAIYRDVLRRSPNDLNARQLLGALMVQDGRAQDAVPLLIESLAIQSDHVPFLINLGTAYSRLRQWDSAIPCYERAMKLRPTDLDAARNLGSVLIKAGRHEESLLPLRTAIQLDPSAISVRLHLAIASVKTGRDSEAEEHFEKVLAEDPNHRQALAGLGQILLKKTEPVERAAECWQRLTVLEPDNPAMFNNLGTILKNLDRLEEAEGACRTALRLLPNFFPALCNLGLVLSGLGRFSEARDCLRAAVRMRSDVTTTAAENPSETKAEDKGNLKDYSKLDEAMWTEYGCVAYCQLAAITNILGDEVEAEDAVTHALAIKHDDPDSRMMRGFLKLQRGEFDQGWPDYEFRRSGKGKFAPRTIGGPDWQGEILPQGTLLIHAEQGLGDTIHFIRYVRLVRPKVGRIVFLSHRPLVKLMRMVPEIDQVIADGDTLPEYHAQVPLLSLPGIFKTSFETVPREVPYLFAADDLVQKWKERLQNIEGFRIGIAWQGNRDFANDEYRRVPLRQFEVLSKVPGVQLLCLQKGDGSEQLGDIDFQIHQFSDVDTVAGAFMDTAAIMKNLDLVISPCTATPHLAGALAVPVWLAKSFAAEWRWMSDDRRENPWYPTMRMFRQPSLGDWDAVFDSMNAEVKNLVTKKLNV